MPKQKAADPQRVVTGVVRASYVNLDEPRETGEGADAKLKYQVTLIIPKKDKVTLKAMKAAAEVAINAKWGDKRPARVHSSLHDGDGERENGEPFGEECEGAMVITVSSDRKPGIVDANVTPVMKPGYVVSGDYIKADIRAYAYERKGKKGVSFGLSNVQFWEKGEPLGNVSRPEDAFEARGDVGDDDDDDDYEF